MDDPLVSVELSDHERTLIAEANLGKQVHEFLQTQHGQYLRGRAQLEIEEAKDGILKCNLDRWWGRKKAKAFQQTVWAAEHFTLWCAEAMINGDQAYVQLTTEDFE